MLGNETDFTSEKRGLLQTERNNQGLARPMRLCFCGVAASMALATVVAVVLHSTSHGEEHSSVKEHVFLSGQERNLQGPGPTPSPGSEATARACPELFPYRCDDRWNRTICYNDKDNAARCWGPNYSWCALDGYLAWPDIKNYVANNASIPCSNVSNYMQCPNKYPYKCLGRWGDKVCYNNKLMAA